MPELEAAVTEGEAAAVPVVDGLHAAVLQLAEDKVVSGVGGKVEAAPLGLPMERKGCNCWLWMMEAALPFSSTALSRAWPTPTVVRPQL